MRVWRIVVQVGGGAQNNCLSLRSWWFCWPSRDGKQGLVSSSRTLYIVVSSMCLVPRSAFPSSRGNEEDDDSVLTDDDSIPPLIPRSGSSDDDYSETSENPADDGLESNQMSEDVAAVIESFRRFGSPGGGIERDLPPGIDRLQASRSSADGGGLDRNGMSLAFVSDPAEQFQGIGPANGLQVELGQSAVPSRNVFSGPLVAGAAMTYVLPRGWLTETIRVGSLHFHGGIMVCADGCVCASCSPDNVQFDDQ